MSDEKMNLYIANPRGFCAGVDRAINIVEMALEKYGAPVYVRAAVHMGVDGAPQHIHSRHGHRRYSPKGSAAPISAAGGGGTSERAAHAARRRGLPQSRRWPGR